ncbi:MAG: YdcF family protein [Ilumatobacteraceae bacterium]
MMADTNVPADVPTDEYPVVEADAGTHGEVAPVGRRPRTPLGIVIRVAIALVALGLVYYVITLYQVWSTGRRDEARPVDAIVVLGAAQYDGRPSPQLAARLDHVLRLWPQGLAPIVVVTGGKQPDDRFTEAEASARYLVERGVPDDAIVFENAGRSTYESLEGVAETLRSRGLESVLLVTDPFHALRTRLTAEELGLDAFVSPTETSVVAGGTSFGKHLKEAAGVSLGRVIGFDRLRGLTG